MRVEWQQIFDPPSLQALALLLLVPLVTGAHTLYKSDQGAKLDLDLDAGVGLFSSQSDYSGQGRGAVKWIDSAARIGLSGKIPIAAGSTTYATVSELGTAVNGDGDAAGFNDGGDSDWGLDEAYVGWRSGHLLGWVDNAVDFSVGRQGFTVGNGWLINGGALAVGTGLVFNETAILRIKTAPPFRGDLFYLASGHAIQGKAKIAGADFEYSHGPLGTLGATYLRVVGVDSAALDGLRAARDGLNTFSVRGQGSLGVDNATFSFETTLQRGHPSVHGQPRDVRAWAWYAEADYRFAQWPLTPKLVYRFSSFSGDDPGTRTLEGYDPLFYGFNRGYGTWIQGDVAGYLTGPFNTNADIQHVGLYLHPPGLLRVGALFFNFRTRQSAGGVSHDFAKEWDFFLDWLPKPNLLISPSYVIFDPGPGAAAALGTDRINNFFQVIAIWRF